MTIKKTKFLSNNEIRHILYLHLKKKYGDNLKGVHSFLVGNGKNDSWVIGDPDSPFKLEYSIEEN